MDFFSKNQAWVDPNAATTPVNKRTLEARHKRFVQGFYQTAK